MSRQFLTEEEFEHEYEDDHEKRREDAHQSLATVGFLKHTDEDDETEICAQAVSGE